MKIEKEKKEIEKNYAQLKVFAEQKEKELN